MAISIGSLALLNPDPHLLTNLPEPAISNSSLGTLSLFGGGHESDINALWHPLDSFFLH